MRQIFTSSRCIPYSNALLSAVPIPDPKLNAQRERLVLEGDVPSPIDPPPGCHFHTRCPWTTDECRTDDPELRELEPAHVAACHHPRNLVEQLIRPSVTDCCDDRRKPHASPQPPALTTGTALAVASVGSGVVQVAVAPIVAAMTEG